MDVKVIVMTLLPAQAAEFGYYVSQWHLRLFWPLNFRTIMHKNYCCMMILVLKTV